MTTKNQYNEYTVRISTDPSYYGSNCTREDAERIASRLTALIESEFSGINVDKHTSGGISKTRGPEQSVIDEIDGWINENWTAAL